MTAPAAPVFSGERDSRTHDYANFDGIEVSGQWQITLERGDAWRVAIDAPAELVDNLRVEQDGDRLELDIDGERWFGGFGRDNDGPKATITMPALESIDVVRCFAGVILGLRRRAPVDCFLGRFRDPCDDQPVRRVVARV